MPQNTKVIENGTALFRCLATGTPTPDHSWYYNGTSIIVGDKYSIGGPGIDYGSLIIRRVEFSDRGDYTCVYNNSVKTLSLDAALSVQGMVHIYISLSLSPSPSLSLSLTSSSGCYGNDVMVSIDSVPLWCSLMFFGCHSIKMSSFFPSICFLVLCNMICTVLVLHSWHDAILVCVVFCMFS